MTLSTENTGFIIQARSGSTRMPDKMLAPFFNDQSILEILMDRFANEANGVPFVIATTTNPLDDRIEKLAIEKGVKVFRGSEENVLQRFLEASKKFGFEKVIRVCADNPLFDISGTLKLLKVDGENGYVAYQLVGNKPSITTHNGFWGELVKVASLEKVSNLTNEKLYREHVTNFIYTHPDLFSVRLVNAPDGMYKRQDIRLTVDTAEDYKLVSEIYAQLQERKLAVTIPNILSLIDSQPKYLEKMKTQIGFNTK